MNPLLQRWQTRSGPLAGAAVALVVVLLWGLLRPLSVEWSVNPQYAYGWGVPALALYLFWRRWRDRPAPTPPTSRAALGLAGAVLALPLLPLRLVQEANPDWRLVSWAGGLAVIGLILVGLGLAGGSPWVRHFTVAVGFLLLAVPWPSLVENALTQGLMRGVAALSVECLNWAGVPALRQGNLIQLNTTVLGINEACSGVRSLQATLMAAVFLGELTRLTAGCRVLLVGLGVGLALALNVVRALFLAWLAAAKGGQAVQTWHDPAGYLIMGVAFAGLCAITAGLERGRSPPPAARTESRPAAAVPGLWLAALGGWLMLSAVGTEVWYRVHETGRAARVTWTLAWPQTDPGFQFNPVDEDVRRLLRPSQGRAAQWQRADGEQWLLYWFRWAPGRAAAALAHAHPPDLCLPAAGFTQTAFLGRSTFRVQGRDLPFRAYRFAAHGNPLFVFYGVWEERARSTAVAGEADATSHRGRLAAVGAGERELGQVMLEVAIGGPNDPRRAAADFGNFLQAHLHPSTPSD